MTGYKIGDTIRITAKMEMTVGDIQYSGFESDDGVDYFESVDGYTVTPDEWDEFTVEVIEPEIVLPTAPGSTIVFAPEVSIWPVVLHSEKWWGNAEPYWALAGSDITVNEDRLIGWMKKSRHQVLVPEPFD